jgi:hypothetical protein
MHKESTVKAMKIIVGLIVIVIAALVVLTFTTNKPAEAINNCYEEATRTLALYEGQPASQQMCAATKTEIETLKQCVNNTYDKYGKLQTAVGKRKLFMTKADPMNDLVTKHNATCANFVETHVK